MAGWVLKQEHLNGENVLRGKVGGRNSEATRGVCSLSSLQPSRAFDFMQLIHL